MDDNVCDLHGCTLLYDIADITQYPDVLQKMELVEITERLPCTWVCYGQYPFLDHPDLFEGNTIVTSKNLKAGLCFKFNENTKKTSYMQMFYNTFVYYEGNSVLNTIRAILVQNDFLPDGVDQQLPFYLICGIIESTDSPLSNDIYLFDIYVGEPGYGRYLNVDEKNYMACLIPIKTAPILYTGPFYEPILHMHKNELGISNETYTRTGIIVTPIVDRYVHHVGRVKLKWVK